MALPDQRFAGRRSGMTATWHLETMWREYACPATGGGVS